MRLALLLPVLFCVAAPAHAEGARESRYGPTTPRQAPAIVAAAPVVRYDGPMLSWANKRQPSADVAASIPVASAPAQPAPVAAWAGYNAPPAPPRPVAPVAYAPPPPAPAARPKALPASLYAPPRPAPVAAATPGPAKDWSGYRSVRMATAASAPARAPTASPTQAPAAAPPPPRQIAAASPGVTGARFYSVARESGLTPDPIPPAGPDRQVLITTDTASAPAEDAAPAHGSADWLAAGARGDDDDDSATRRAKTRNEGL
jgi:hypothetical protein